MSKDYCEVITNDTVSVPVANEPEDPVFTGVEQDSVKVRKRRTRAEIDAGLTLDEINGIKNINSSVEDQKLQESVDKVVSGMKSKMGLLGSLSDSISQQQLDEWKLQHGELYRTYLNGQSFIWHKIKRKDYVSLMTDSELSNIDNAELRIFLRQEKITKMCVLYPDKDTLEKIVENNAGVAGNISDEIMMISGFRPVNSEQIS